MITCVYTTNRTLKNGILCVTKSLHKVNKKYIRLADFMLFRQDRTAASIKTRGGGLCIFVNNSWCTKSKEVSRFCSPEVEYLMVNSVVYSLSWEFSSVFFWAVYMSPQTDAGTKTTLNEQYMAISKQENAHPEVALLLHGNFNAGKLICFTSFLPAC
jgi:hypothetical protein